MKTLIIYMTTITLINAGVFFHDFWLLTLGLLTAVILWKHSKTLTLKPMSEGCGRSTNPGGREM